MRQRHEKDHPPGTLTPELASVKTYHPSARRSLLLFHISLQKKDIREILENPDFDRIAAFKKQKELLLLKRNRTDRLIQLLSRLEKGEQCMSFKEFDLSDYIDALEDFKSRNTNEIMEQQWSSVPEEMRQNDLFSNLASHKEQAVSSDEVQHIVREIIAQAQGNAPELAGSQDHYCNLIIDLYSNDYPKAVFNTKNGAGSADYIVEAFRYYLENNCPRKWIAYQK